MKHLLLFLAFLQIAAAAEPLRVFIRSGPKTHREGCHDYPAFLKDWTKLLNERGAKATGGDDFPTTEQLAETDVLILHASEAGNIVGEERKNLEAYLERGGGVVALHGGAVSRDPDWYKTVIGGSWEFGYTKFLEGHMSLYFTDRENPITRGVSNFDLEDEIYYDMRMMPEAKILAAAYTPKGKDGSVGKGVNVYDIQPQVWTYETGKRRAFVCLPGHVYANFSHTTLQTILLRGIAWAGKMEDADVFLKDKPATEEALRYPFGGPTRPEEAAAKIELHPEFEISLMAAEPLINKAMNIDWDEKGRMWVVETPEYPNGLRKVNTDVWKDSGSVKPGVYDRDPLDRVSILSDTNGDGRMDKKHVFVDKLELATSFVLHKNGVIVSAAPDIWFIEDTDGDEVADKRTKLYTGLGIGDTHAVINNLRWGLDGWVYATHGYSAGKVKSLGAPEKPEVGIGSGVVRFKPDGTEIEQYASRRGNTWGLCMTSDGQCFWTQPTSGTVFFHTVLPEYVLAKGKMPGTESYKGMVVGQKTFPLMDWEQAAYKQIDWVGSYTAAAGCAVYEGGAWPEKWNRSYFVGEPTINIVSQYFVKPEGITYTTEKEKGREETEFIRSKDLWFRPIETRIGPDGALYLIDFYNQAVIHNDTRGPQHGPASAAVRPDRDHYFGRIWRIQHKDAKKIDVPVIDRAKSDSVDAALRSPNAHTRMTAMRLLREAGKPAEADTGSAALKAYEEFKGNGSQEGRAKLISAFAAAGDDWTRSALIAAAGGQALDVVLDCLKSEDAATVGPLAVNLLPAAWGKDPAAGVEKLIAAVADAPVSADPLKAAIVDAIVGNKSLKPPLTPAISSALGKLIANPATLTKALPLVSRWDTDGKMAATLEKQVARLSDTLSDSKAGAGERLAAARTLAAVGTNDAVARALSILRDPNESPELQSAIVTALGEANLPVKLATPFNELSPGIRNAAFDEIVKRPEAAMALLDGVDSGKVDPKNISPGNIARLRSHPDKGVSKKANAIMDKLMPGAKEKQKLIAEFLPVVTQPGDPANGKVLFTAACAVCHKFGDQGADVGPGLTGMGAHGAAELLVHIIDPNREVDPSFWQWNITMKSGETFAGVVTSENRATVNLRNQGGDMEIRKEDIAKRENTQRSLMPEGLDGLGAANIRDILAYMTSVDAGRHRVIDLRGAYTADARRGLFADENAAVDSVFPKAYGDVQAMGIPFFLMDPEKSPDGRSLIVLKGGRGKATAQHHPQKVTVKTDVQASRLHLISGIAGWGFPAIPDEIPAMKVTLTHKDGATETVEFLNKRDFADYNREIDAPGSKLLKDFVSRGQLRLLSLDVKKPGPITSITLESHDNGISPVVVAITAELGDPKPDDGKTSAVSPSDQPPGSTAATSQKFKEPKGKGTIRVLVAGAGSSHHFPRDFIKADTETLSAIPGADVIGTMNLAEALDNMPKADVLVFSGNHNQWGTKEFQKALHDFADAGKGILMLHAATWEHPWKGYNERFVTGRTTSHGKGSVAADCIRPADHLLLTGVPESFTIEDESYHFKFHEGAKSTVLIENKPDGKSPASHPALWIVNDPKAKIVCYTHGHDEKSHAHPAYKAIITNFVNMMGPLNK